MYADNVANLQDRLTQMRATQADAFAGETQAQTDAFNEKTKGYSEKWQAIEQAGGEDIAGMLGAHGVYSGYKKIKKLYNGVQERKKALNQTDDDAPTGDAPAPAGTQAGAGEPDLTPQAPTGPDAMAQPNAPAVDSVAPTPRAAPENRMLEDTSDDFDIAPSGLGDLKPPVEPPGPLSQLADNLGENLASKGRDIKAGFQSVKDFFSRSGGDAGAAEGAEGGEALAGFATTDAVLGAVPVIGEVALAVGGLVAIGDGIYHLFHHPKAPPTQAAPPPVQAPTSMIAKYSLALPSVDSSVDRAASVGSF
tara:strand:- start:4736 stop:5656 length:921 start_codon:yes stop_codon:yes gene_type:complete